MTTIPLAQQIKVMDEIIAWQAQHYPRLMARGRMSSEETVRLSSGAHAIKRTLEWLEANQDLARELHAIKTHPAVKAIHEEWPDATIAKVATVSEGAAP